MDLAWPLFTSPPIPNEGSQPGSEASEDNEPAGPPANLTWPLAITDVPLFYPVIRAGEANNGAGQSRASKTQKTAAGKHEANFCRSSSHPEYTY